MNRAVGGLKKRVERALSPPLPHDIISYPPLRSFWLASYGPLAVVVRLDLWLAALEAHITGGSMTILTHLIIITKPYHTLT